MFRTMLVAMAIVATTAPALSAELEVLRAEADVFRTARDGANLVEDRWTLFPDGTYRGVHQLMRNASHVGLYVESHPAQGRWSAQGNRLCLEGSGLQEGAATCMRVNRVGGETSRYQYSATSEGSGQSWALFIYPHAR